MVTFYYLKEIGINGGVCVSRKSYIPHYTSLMIAAEVGCQQCIVALLQHSADVNFTEPITKTRALRLALYKGHVDCTLQLLEAGAAVDGLAEPIFFPSATATTFYTYCPCSVLIAAIRHFNGTMNAGSMVPGPTLQDGKARDVWLTITERILQQGASVNDSGCHLETAAVIEAVENMDTRVLELLLRHGAEPNLKSHVQLQLTPQVSTALDLACFSNNYAAASLLVAHGASVAEVSKELFYFALEHHFFDIVTLLLMAGYTSISRDYISYDVIKMVISDLENNMTNCTDEPGEIWTCPAKASIGRLKDCCTSSWTLKSLCRLTIRVQAKVINRSKVSNTGLPPYLQDYVLCQYL